jgi:hypothetical protein
MDGKLVKVCHRHYTKDGDKKEQFKHHWQMKNGWKTARLMINCKRNGIQDSIRKHAIKCKQVCILLAYLFVDDMTLTFCLCCFLLASHCQTLKTTTPVLKGDEEPIWSPTNATTVTTNEDDSTPTDATASMPISWNTDSIDSLGSELQTNEDL